MNTNQYPPPTPRPDWPLTGLSEAQGADVIVAAPIAVAARLALSCLPAQLITSLCGGGNGEFEVPQFIFVSATNCNVSIKHMFLGSIKESMDLGLQELSRIVNGKTTGDP